MKTSPSWSWKFQILKAQSLVFQGKNDDALALLEPDTPANLPFALQQHKRIVQADALCRAGNREKGESLLAEEARVNLDGDRIVAAELALTRGHCAMSSDAAAAQKYFSTAYGLAHGQDEFLEAVALLNLGYLMLRGGSCQEAIDKFNEGLKVTDSPLLKEKMFDNLAECYAELGDWVKSASLADPAEKLAAKIGNADDQRTALINLGRVHLVLFAYDDAQRDFAQALAITRKNDVDSRSRCLNLLTQLALRRHKFDPAEQRWLDAAEQRLKEESELSLSPDRLVYLWGDTADLAIEHKEFSKAEDALKKVLQSKASNNVLLNAQRELGYVYWREGKFALAERTFLQAIANAEAVLARLPAQYRMSFLDEVPFYDTYIRFLVDRGRPLEALKFAERGRAQSLSQVLGDRQTGFDLHQLQAVLKRRNRIALAYSLTDDESFLWVITPATFKLFRLPAHRLLAPQIDAYHREVIEHPRAIEDASGLQQFYQILVQPAESLIPPGSQVVVIPSKILSEINFEALVVPGSPPHYWLQDVEIETASSLALLALSRPADPTTTTEKQLFLLGAPVPADPELPILKHAVEEMDRVSRHFSETQKTVVSGEAAVPTAYRANRPGRYRFIHVDAHSLPSNLNPLDSFIVLSPSAGKSYKLFAHDIEEAPLHADLVTISACYSAGSRWYQGEGIVGLGWAFLRAGAHQVVASLWAVDDASTPQLMDDFYSELSQGKPAAQALRDAKLNMLRSGGLRSRPYYWASLQLYTRS